jgi:hypothetical protein
VCDRARDAIKRARRVRPSLGCRDAAGRPRHDERTFTDGKPEADGRETVPQQGGLLSESRAPSALAGMRCVLRCVRIRVGGPPESGRRTARTPRCDDHATTSGRRSDQRAAGCSAIIAPLQIRSRIRTDAPHNRLFRRVWGIGAVGSHTTRTWREPMAGGLGWDAVLQPASSSTGRYGTIVVGLPTG